MDDFEKVIFETINFWLGKKGNPLTGKTMLEIYNLSKTIGKENIK